MKDKGVKRKGERLAKAFAFGMMLLTGLCMPLPVSKAQTVCRVLQAEIDQKPVQQEDTILYRNGEELKLSLWGEGEKEVKISVMRDLKEQEILPDYEDVEENLWRASAVLPAEEGRMKLQVYRNTSGVREVLYDFPDVWVDRTAPETRLRVLTEEGVLKQEEEDGRVYMQEHAILELTVREACPGAVSFREGMTDKLTIWLQGADGQEEMPKLPELSWEAVPGETDTWRTCIRLWQEGIYEICWIAEDPAGNASLPVKQKLCLDQRAPETDREHIRVFCGEKEVQMDGQKVFGNQDLCLKLPLKDSVSGLKTARICLRSGEDQPLQLLEPQTWETPSREGMLDLNIREEGSYAVGVMAEDRAGNRTGDWEWVAFVTLEKEVPELVCSIGEAAGKNGIYREDVPIQVLVEDMGSGIAKAGITAEGEALACWQPENASEKNRLERTILLDRNAFQGVHELLVWAEDRAGNRIRESRIIEIDSEAPRMELVFEAQKEAQEGFFARPRKARLQVWDEHFDETGIRLSNGQELLKTENFRWNEKEACMEAELLFDLDGDYRITGSCTDLAGNTGFLKELKPFAVDCTAPVIEVQRGTAAGEDNCFREKLTFLLQVTEKNPDPDGITWTLYKDGKAQESEGFPGSFRWKNGIGSALLTFEEEGCFSFAVQVRDLAGNSSRVFRSKEFVLDFTAPSLSLQGIRENSSNAGEVCFEVEASDEGSGTKQIQAVVYRDGRRQGLLFQKEESDKIIRMQFPALPRERALDGQYRIEAYGLDEAGNESSQVWYFSVNRFGSDFILGRELRTAAEAYYINKVPDIQLTERNPDEITSRKILLSDSDGVRILKEGKDYTVESVGGADEWYCYHYRLHSGLFEKDGFYRLSLHTQDRAGNRMDTREGQPLDFCLDRSGPSVSFPEVPEGMKTFDTGKMLTIQIRSISGIRQVSFLLDQEERARYEEKEVEDADGIFRMYIGAEAAGRSLWVEAEDLAGNRCSFGPLLFRTPGRASGPEASEETASDTEKDKVPGNTASPGSPGMKSDLFLSRVLLGAKAAGLLVLTGGLIWALVHFYGKGKKKKKKVVDFDGDDAIIDVDSLKK